MVEGAGGVADGRTGGQWVDTGQVCGMVSKSWMLFQSGFILYLCKYNQFFFSKCSLVSEYVN